MMADVQQYTEPVSTVNKQVMTPTAPKCSSVSGNKVTVSWTTDVPEGKPAYYQIRQRQLEANCEWVESTFEEINIQIQASMLNLKSGSRFLFQVRAVYEDGEMSPYSESSLAISTDPPSPSTPTCLSVNGNNITISWTIPSQVTEPIYYEVRQKQGTESEWFESFYQEKGNQKRATIQNLKYQNAYQFKVRAVYQDGKMSPYSEISDIFTTDPDPSSSVNILPLCTPVTCKTLPPRLYRLPVCEYERDPDSKTRKCVIGTGKPPVAGVEEKVILIVGELGSGKSTFIDWLMNYLFGVIWEDNFRFTLAEDEKSFSQTEWITSYTLYVERNDIPKMMLTIIDTPGFNDAKLPDYNEKLNSRIRMFFPELQEHGEGTIDAVCFVMKSHATTNHEYIFDSILSTFGKDVKDNIVVMATFADETEPPVKAVLERANVPYTKMFKTNTLPLLDDNLTNKSDSCKKNWFMNADSIRQFIAHILQLPKRSLKMTSFVLDTRDRLATIISGLRPLIARGLEDMQIIQKEKQLVKDFEQQIIENQNFTYTEESTVCKHLPIAPGTYVTNCLVCDHTCHYPCQIPENKDKERCLAMKNKYCTVCPGNCHWKQHRNNGYKVEYSKVTKTKTHEDIKRKYDLAIHDKHTTEKIIQGMEKEYKNKRKQVNVLLEKVRECNNFLAEYALKAPPLSSVESIHLMIQSEEKEKKAGYAERIKLLEEFKNDAELIDDKNNPLPDSCWYVLFLSIFK